MASETLLMFSLTKAEQLLIKRLIRSFEIKAEPVKKISFKDYGNLFHEKKISLVILHVGQDRIRQVEKIRRVKKLLTIPVPILVLVPKELSSNIHSYIKAGADDYIVMPLNEDNFSIRFYVLLECGQAILQAEHSKKPQKKNKKEAAHKDSALWHRIVGYLQDGLNFFAPQSPLVKKGGQPIFHKWEPVRKLATGGDGVIWLVREIETERAAVAKIPHSRQMNINSLRAAAVLKRLVYHPNIVHLIEVVKDNGTFILIQEYVEGVTLPELLQSSISPREKENIFLQLLSVTAYSHDHKIIHRDIKPDNIMVRPDGKLKLLDFGSAKEIDWMDGNTAPEGTLSFMSPEQMQGNTCIASDVWALGIILYILTVNRLPFYQDNSCYPMDIEIQTTAVPPCKIKSNVPVKLEQVIMECLEENLEKRYKNASKLWNDLLRKFPNFGNGKQIPE
ncbi:MAG: protein kinase [Thermodesulfobacteriota bacterium]|nr:protein kinase [Thermodesulfobacteriota bacterium]